MSGVFAAGATNRAGCICAERKKKGMPEAQALNHAYIRLEDITLHTVQAGNRDGPLAILLHGFPEFWFGWRAQIPALAQAGYNVWVPDQRGYNLSDKPRSIAAYNLDRLAEDVVGLIDAAGYDEAFLIGHDWGAAVAWWVAIKFPRRIRRLVILNVPHPIVMRRFVRDSVVQRLRSWYIAFFQIPWLPESLLRLDNWRAARVMMGWSSNPDTFESTDIARYVGAWSRPQAMRSMIGWYRALTRTHTARLSDLRVRVPTRIIWGQKDIALESDMATLSLAMCDASDLFFLEDASHWVQHDQPQRVNDLILEFLKR